MFKGYSLINLFFFFCLMIYQLLFLEIDLMFYLSFVYIVLNMLCSFLSRGLFFFTTVSVLRISGFFRYFIMAITMTKSSYTGMEGASFWILLIELLVQYFVIFYINFFHSRKKDYLTQYYEKKPTISFNFYFIILLVVTILCFSLNPSLLSNFFTLNFARSPGIQFEGPLAIIFKTSIVSVLLFIIAFIENS
ncbi:TPA: hypothetical protein ACGO7H_002000, partial [Streptococcus suis]